jgi:phage tail tube protein FII
MKAITLIQPWATLIILGEKKIETRSWSTNLRGEIAIHAGKKIDKSVFEKPYYREAFKKYGITVDNIITSSLIGRCKIVDVKKTEDLIDVINEG